MLATSFDLQMHQQDFFSCGHASKNLFLRAPYPQVFLFLMARPQKIFFCCRASKIYFHFLAIEQFFVFAGAPANFFLTAITPGISNSVLKVRKVVS